jgi:hypothetical protein
LQQSDPSSWTIRQKPQGGSSYHQINSHASSERDNYLLHQQASPNNACETSLSKRRVSCDNSSPIYDQMPATPYSSEPPTPSYHSNYSSSSYLAPSPSSANLLTNDPFSGSSRASIPLEHFPPTPYSDDLHSPNSEHSGYTSSTSAPPSVHEQQVLSGNQDFDVEGTRQETETQLPSCLDGYDSQRNGGDDDQMEHQHSSSFDARDEVKPV